MKQCPNCGNYMEWYMEYRCGVPYGDWRCKRCGYDTARLQTYATSNTQIDTKQKRGRWLWGYDVRCSLCGYKLQTTGLPSYCPNCGAKME